MNKVVGIGIDLTQHIPLVGVSLCPAAAQLNGDATAEALARHWPPTVELRGEFSSQAPVALLPIMRGEPLMAGDAAATHRRSIGFEWPVEAQVPFASDPQCGVGRIPLVAAWSAILPQNHGDDSMSRRDDHEFSWSPDGPHQTLYSARAGEVLARSIKAFLALAEVPFDKCLTAIIVPDALDEAGQQLLLDNLAQIGFQFDRIHLLPRPLAVALHWCQLTAPPVQAGDDADGTPAGRLRVLTMALDLWEAQSMEIRACSHLGRTWLTPMRDRSRLAGALPELPLTGLSLALACAHAESASSPFGWWHRLFGSDWIAHRLAAGRGILPAELQLLRDFRSANPPKALRTELEQLPTLHHLWSRLFQPSPPLLEVIADRWPRQEQRLNTERLPCLAVLADGTFARLPSDRGRPFAHLAGDDVQTDSLGHCAAVRGAALAATAIAHGLPCYRETLLPLDLYVRARDGYGDPAPQWKPLVAAQSVEAGHAWKTPNPVVGFQIRRGQERLWLPLRRVRGRARRGTKLCARPGTAAAGGRSVRHRGLRYRHGQAEPRSHERDLPLRADPREAGKIRDSSFYREGAIIAGLRAALVVARPSAVVRMIVRRRF